MNLRDILSRIWNDVFPNNVIYLSVYRLERQRKYPNVGFKFFRDWLLHKKWMIQEAKRLTREAHNKRVAQLYKVKPLNPQGTPQ